jgi:hypothetical protein
MGVILKVPILFLTNFLFCDKCQETKPPAGPPHMQTDSDLQYLSAMSEITREVIQTVADREGDSQPRQSARQHATAWSIASLQPRDPVETMLAGHCVIFDHLLRDAARDAFGTPTAEIRLRVRSQVLAIGKLFLAQLERLEQRQARFGNEGAIQDSVDEAASSPAEPEAQREDADAAEAIQQPVAAESVSSAVEVPPSAKVSAPSSSRSAVVTTAKVDGTSCTKAGGAGIQSNPTAVIRQEPTRQSQPVVRPASAAHDAGRSPQIASAAPIGASTALPVPAIGQPDQPQGTPRPPSVETERGGAGQTISASRHVEALAMRAASLSPGIADRTMSNTQLNATARVGKVEEPV